MDNPKLVPSSSYGCCRVKNLRTDNDGIGAYRSDNGQLAWSTPLGNITRLANGDGRLFAAAPTGAVYRPEPTVSWTNCPLAWRMKLLDTF